MCMHVHVHACVCVCVRVRERERDIKVQRVINNKMFEQPSRESVKDSSGKALLRRSDF